MEDEIKLTKKEKREMRRSERELESSRQSRGALLKKIGSWTALFAVLGLLAFGTVKLISRGPANTLASLAPVAAEDHALGNPAAKATLIEYSDFQCPACAAYHPIVKQLVSEMGDKIFFVYRHFPLKQIHKQAELAGWASEAAGKQDKFWEMQDKIFAGQKEWEKNSKAADIFVKYAQDLKLDIGKFEADMNSKEAKDRVEKDYASGLLADVTYTPTFYLNGKKIANPRSLDEFKQLVEEAAK